MWRLKTLHFSLRENELHSDISVFPLLFSQAWISLSENEAGVRSSSRTENKQELKSAAVKHQVKLFSFFFSSFFFFFTHTNWFYSTWITVTPGIGGNNPIFIKKEDFHYFFFLESLENKQKESFITSFVMALSVSKPDLKTGMCDNRNVRKNVWGYVWLGLNITTERIQKLFRRWRRFLSKVWAIRKGNATI